MSKTSNMVDTSLTREAQMIVQNEYQKFNFHKRILFICTAGILRSATCAAVAAHYGFNARAAGSKDVWALIPVTERLLSWSDIVVFVNQENELEVLHKFPKIDRPTYVWDIPDVYNYGDKELVSIVEPKIKELAEMFQVKKFNLELVS